ncbi:MAG: efflux RND transporter periplasmic adaptor subunit, partial [Hyphomicrobiales bacterium]
MKRQVPLLKQLIVFALLLGGAAALWFGREQAGEVFARISGPAAEDGAAAKPAAVQKVPVVVARVGQATNDAAVEAVGTGRARRSVTLYAEASGEVVEFPVQAGGRVARGDVVLRMEASNAELAVMAAKTRLVEAQRQAERSQQLRSERINSQANVDDAHNLLKRAEIELNQAEEALRERILLAPFGGVVGIPKVEHGDRITSSTEVITLDDRSELYIEFEIPELYFSRVSVGEKVVALTPSFGDHRFTGTIDQIDTRVDPDARAVMARAVLPNTDDLLRPGMSFAVEVVLAGKPYPLIPELALLWIKGQSHVWRINEGKAQKVPVRIVKR